MKANDFQRFADDLRWLTGVSVELRISSAPDGLHTLQINGADFFFNADGSGYNGWGRALVPMQPLPPAQSLNPSPQATKQTRTGGARPSRRSRGSGTDRVSKKPR